MTTYDVKNGRVLDQDGNPAPGVQAQYNQLLGENRAWAQSHGYAGKDDDDDLKGNLKGKKGA